MDKPDEKGSLAMGAGGESNPMAMGMAMAKKMMSQMGAGGGPMEMMQKMMGPDAPRRRQTSNGEDDGNVYGYVRHPPDECAGSACDA
jgi:hypothetical protein